MRCSDNLDLGGVCEDQGLGFRSTNGDYVIRSNSVTKRDPCNQGRKGFKRYKLGGFDFLTVRQGSARVAHTRDLATSRTDGRT